MKWLILAFLMSCGHESPPARDVGDSDGDQVPNYLEANDELQKYVAEVIPFGKVEGVLSFKLNNQIVTVKLGNDHDAAAGAMKLLTKTMSTLRSGDFFSEWSHLKVETNSFQIPASQFSVTLHLETNDRPESVTLTDGKAEIEIGKFSERMEFDVSGDELQHILSGALKFNLRRPGSTDPYSVENTIRDRTYRVFLYDGRTSRVHYVSQELPFPEYLKLSKISQSYEIKNFRGFIQKDTANLWWTRVIGEKDRVVVKASLETLSKFHLTNFEKRDASVSRNNGSPGSKFQIVKAPEVQYVLKIRGSKTVRSFKTSSRSYFRGHEADIECREYSRVIKATRNEVVSKHDLLENLVITSTGTQKFLKDFLSEITEGVDENGWYLELALDSTPDQFEISLVPRSRATFHRTGVYDTICNGRSVISGTQTNDEGQMNLKIESFVEKID